MLLVSFDLSAAFDTIRSLEWSRATKARLCSVYGVDGNALMWLEFNLSLKVQYVKFDQDVSFTTHLKTGILQRSVHGFMVRFLDPLCSLPSSPPFNLSPVSSMLTNNNMQMTPKFSSPYQEVTPRTRLVALKLHYQPTQQLHSSSITMVLATTTLKNSEAILLGTHPCISSPDWHHSGWCLEWPASRCQVITFLSDHFTRKWLKTCFYSHSVSSGPILRSLTVDSSHVSDLPTDSFCDWATAPGLLGEEPTLWPQPVCFKLCIMQLIWLCYFQLPPKLLKTRFAPCSQWLDVPASVIFILWLAWIIGILIKKICYILPKCMVDRTRSACSISLDYKSHHPFDTISIKHPACAVDCRLRELEFWKMLSPLSLHGYSLPVETSL